MAATVLVVTEVNDPTADLVIRELYDRGTHVARIDPGDFPHQVKASAAFDDSGMSGTLTTPTRSIESGALRSVYWRRPSPYRAPAHLDTQDAAWVVDQSRWGFGGVLASLPEALYVNHPWRNRDAESKPAQLAAAATAGFTVPPTLVTNNPDAAREFAAKHAPIVYKPLWHGDYHADDGTGRTIWVQCVLPENIDESVAGAAHQFQACVDKEADIRLTVVSDRMFAVRIDGAPRLDWRQDYPLLAYTSVPVPDHITEAVRIYLSVFGLEFGAFDFALRRDGAWVFLECNPNGQWAWFDDPVPAQITRAIADLLEKGRA